VEIEKYKLQIARLRRMQFGRSSEKIARAIEQLELKLEELETETPPTVSEATAAQAEAGTTLEQPSSPQLPKSARRALPAHLPARDVVHAPSCACPVCGREMRKVSEDVTEILDYIPGHFEVVRHVRPAFSWRRRPQRAGQGDPLCPLPLGGAHALPR